MPFSVSDICLGFVLPLASAAFLAWLGGRFLSERLLAAIVAAAAVAAFHVGYWSLQLGRLKPESHWEWLPWLLTAAVVPACMSGSSTFVVVGRRILIAAVAALSAWLLVPDFASVAEIKSRLLLMMGAGILVSAVLFERVESTGRTDWGLGVLTIGSFVAVVVMLLSGSLRFAQLGLCAAAGFSGLAAVRLCGCKVPVAGLSTIAGLWFCGSMFAACVNSFSTVPRIAYVLCAAVPAAAGISGWWMSDDRRKVVQWFLYAVPLVLALAAAGIAAYADLTAAGDDGW